MKLLLSEIETEALKYALAKFKYGSGAHDGHALELDNLYKEVCELLEGHRNAAAAYARDGEHKMPEIEAIGEASEDFFKKYHPCLLREIDFEPLEIEE